MAVFRKIYTQLLFLGLFFIPFNSYQGLDFLGEFSRESAFLFFSFGFAFFLFNVVFKNKIAFPLKNEVFLLLITFILYCFVCSLLNGFDIYDNYFKHTSGVVRFIKQYIVLIISGVFFLLYYYKVFSEFTVGQLLIKIRRVFLYSFIILWIYAILEILVVVLKKDQFLPVLHLFDYFPFTEVRLDRNHGRISSVSFESPFLAIYLITVAGWMFSYILTNKGASKFLPAMGVILMTFFSGSRTALVVIVIQLAFFLGFTLKIRKYRKYFFYFTALALTGFVALLVFTKGDVIVSIKDKLATLNFEENLTKSVSNKSRFGMQYANIKVFKKHPIIGVGYGQQSYHSRKYYPEWATRDNYEFELMYLNEDERSFPPGFNLYIRLLAETGIIGFGLFTFFLIIIFLKLNRVVKDGDKQYQVMAIIIYISMIGYVINWLQVDTFRIFGFWICVALLMRLQKRNRQLISL